MGSVIPTPLPKMLSKLTHQLSIPIFALTKAKLGNPKCLLGKPWVLTNPSPYTHTHTISLLIKSTQKDWATQFSYTLSELLKEDSDQIPDLATDHLHSFAIGVEWLERSSCFGSWDWQKHESRDAAEGESDCDVPVHFLLFLCLSSGPSQGSTQGRMEHRKYQYREEGGNARSTAQVIIISLISQVLS